MKRILSVLLALSMLVSLAACSSDKDDAAGYSEEASEEPLNASEIQNEAIKTLVGDGRLDAELTYDLPTTIGLIRRIADEARYENTVYDELPAKVRNVSKFILDGVLEKVDSVNAHTGTYTFVRFSNTEFGDTTYLTFDDSNRVYRVMMFNDGEKSYKMFAGPYTDFSNSYFYKDKSYAKFACRHLTVVEDTNEILFCTKTFPISKTESVDVFYDENGEMLYCCDKSNGGEKFFSKSFREITKDDCETNRDDFVGRIKRKHKIDIAFQVTAD